jgi:DNA mismatch repair protein MutL
VADLFYNTPARAKHLKATGTEWGHVVETVTDAALGWPGVHFVLTRDGRAARTLPPARDLVGRVRQVYPKELTDQLVPVDATDREAPGRRLTGLVARPGFSRTGREHQKLIVGGRCVRCPSLAHAVYAAYEAALSTRPSARCASTTPAACTASCARPWPRPWAPSGATPCA